MYCTRRACSTYMVACVRDRGKTTMAMWAFRFVQSDLRTKTVRRDTMKRSCGSESALPSTIRTHETVSCVSAFRTFRSSKRTQEMGHDETHLPKELRVQNLPKTLLSPFPCHPRRKGRRPVDSSFMKSNRRSAEAEVPSPPSAVTGGSLSHSKCPTKAAMHGEGFMFLLSSNWLFAKPE